MKYNFLKLPFSLSIALLIFSCLSFSFLYIKIKNTDTVSTQIFNKWQEENQKRNDLKYLDHLIKSIDQERTLLNAHFAEASDVVPFLNTIEKLAIEGKAEAEVVFVSVLDTDKTLSLQIKPSGSFESVYKFLMLLENSPYELDLSSLEMQRVSADDATDNSKAKNPQWSVVFWVKLLSFIP